MAYTPTYTSDDISPSVIDGLVAIFVVFANLAVLVGLVLLYRWMKKQGVRIG